MTASQPGKLTFSVAMDSPQPGTQVSSGAGRDDTANRADPAAAEPAVLVDRLLGSSRPALRREAEGARQTAAPIRSVGRSAGDLGRKRHHSRLQQCNQLPQLSRHLRAIPCAPSRLRSTVRSRRPTRNCGDHIADFGALFSRVRLQLGRRSNIRSTDGRAHSQTSPKRRTQTCWRCTSSSDAICYLVFTAGRTTGKPARHLERQSEAALEQQVDHQHQSADELLAGRCRRPLGNRAAALGPDRRPAAEWRGHAKVHYHSEGWVLHHNTDLWRATAPVDGPWGIWPMGQAWLANQMWDHYLFTGDRDFLQAAGVSGNEGSRGVLPERPGRDPRWAALCGPAGDQSFHLSGERLPAGWQARPPDLCSHDGHRADQELFENTRAAARILGKDADFSARLELRKNACLRCRLATQGQLQEWIKDSAETEPHHRHMSHLYSLYPGHDIDMEKTPAHGGRCAEVHGAARRRQHRVVGRVAHRPLGAAAQR